MIIVDDEGEIIGEETELSAPETRSIRRERIVTQKDAVDEIVDDFHKQSENALMEFYSATSFTCEQISDFIRLTEIVRILRPTEIVHDSESDDSEMLVN